MSEITNIVKSGKDKYSIYLDNAFYCFLKDETILNNHIKVGKIVEKEELDKIQLENEKLIALDKALKYISAIKTEKQVKDYLYSKGYTSETVKYVINKLKEYNYLNDEIFAKAYFNSYSKTKGLRKLKFELETKGVSREIIEEISQDYEDDEETLNNLARKYLSGKTRDRKTMQKLSNHLFSKGFTFEKINKVIKKYYTNFDEENYESWDWYNWKWKRKRNWKCERQNFHTKWTFLHFKIRTKRRTLLLCILCKRSSF